MSDQKEPRPDEGPDRGDEGAGSEPEAPAGRAADREAPGPGDAAAGEAGDEAGSRDSGRAAGSTDADGSRPAGRPAPHRADETLRTGALPDAVECPHCGETESEQFSAFGSAVSVSQYYCRSCRTVFEFFKWR